MKRLRNHLIGIDQGDTVLFSDFEDGGEMWTGRGQRERRRRISFAEPFRAEPSVHVSISMWDVDTASALRADTAAETITKDGFDLVFRTWGDTRVARIRLAWMAIGELRQADDWDLY
ncbi:H-type lectin domain-containing protein [uncultured Tateyamaria sp.]|uniref:H-type lectin domain-containing protein n=1 Tax=uncultured Tateyamaria sp. TaxID=455651 RepID=UPI002633C21E|nr:H-type lectin domain-containing protein [uncultured Tateyamaria sp.]